MKINALHPVPVWEYPASHDTNNEPNEIMTPEQAGEILRYIEDYPAIVRRYVLEGGRRQEYKCVASPGRCAWRGMGESQEEARVNVNANPEARNGCHHRMEPTGRFEPPHDFS